ncbi:MAG: carbohydrate ABC transporter permease [Anaerolineales bacterium]|nr:MAG: carbohydrate ABC transporter permease [Anaerolineales bacterium]
MTNLRSLATQIAVYSLLTLIAFFMILPFIWMLSTSFKPQDEIFRSPPILISPNMSLDGYRYIVDLGALRVLWNTFFIAFTSTALSLFFCTLGGYGFAKYRFPGRGALFAFLLGTMIIPSAVLMVPTYIIMLKLGWLDTYWPLIIPGAANAFGIFFMRQYISTISDELLDAARIDGCSEFGIFLRCILPICTPGLTTLGLIFFMSSWNNYLYPSIYLKSPDKFTLPLLMVQMQGPPGYSLYREWMGVAVVSIVPLLIIFLIFQRRFTEGITAGAIK